MKINKSNFEPRRLPVKWLEARPFAMAIHPQKVRGSNPPPRAPGSARGPIRPTTPPSQSFFMRSLRAFTLLELMLVIAIIGLIAGMTMHQLSNFGQANSINGATRQILEDCALARQKAMATRSTVYMVFVPPAFWTYTNYQNVPYNNQESNLVTHQYGAYALVSLSTVGDQPGQHTPRYLTDWRYLPNGVFFSPMEFTNPYVQINTTNTLSGTINSNYIQPWNLVNVPFPSVYGTNAVIPLPCIGFSPQGSLSTNVNQFIVLARGSIFYPTDTNGAILEQLPNLVETPPNNDINIPNLIQIDWLTARAALLQNQLQ